MTTVLLLLRHAKAGWAAPGMRDYDRPLTDVGVKECALLGARMAAAGYRPAQVLCSGAERTRQTLDLVARQSAEPWPNVTYLDSLYESDAARYLAIIRERSAPAGPLLVVGHNPMMEDLAAALPRADDAQQEDAMRGGFPTSGLAVIGFDMPYSEIRPGSGRLLAMLDGRA